MSTPVEVTAATDAHGPSARRQSSLRQHIPLIEDIKSVDQLDRERLTRSDYRVDTAERGAVGWICFGA
jgi:hypothetical protein